MDSTLIATVVGVLGAGFLGMLGYFLQALRSDIGGLGTRLGSAEDSLARIETTLAEHGRLLDRMADRVSGSQHSRASSATTDLVRCRGR